MRRFLVVLAAGATLALAWVPQAQAASGPPSSLHIQGRATLKAGIQVALRLKITCGPYTDFEPGENQVSLEQAVGSQIASGSGALTLVCDGTQHLIKSYVWAAPSGPPFQAGPAAVQVSIAPCGEAGGSFSCSPASERKVVQLVAGGGSSS